MNALNHRFSKGLSLLEVLITVSALGILGALAVTISGNVQGNLQQVKLEQDVKTINSAINAYLANGGKLDKLSDPQEILDRMKSGHSKTTRTTFVGMTGAMIDKRLAVKSVSNQKASFAAVWLPSKQRFEVQENPDNGVTEFVLDESLAEVEYKPIERDESALAYNDKPGWIWAYEDKPVTHPSGPTVIPLGKTPDNSIPRTPPKKLIPPFANPSGGSFPQEDFPMTVSLTNPNNSSTWIMVAINGGSFNTYTGPLTLTGQTALAFYATGSPDFWIKSDNRYEAYSVLPPPDPEQLVPPLINLSHMLFDDSTPEITVAISNPNVAGSSSLFYALVPSGDSHDAQANWSPYAGEIVANVADYPDGFDVIAYAKSSDPELFIDSAPAGAQTTAEFFNIPVVGNVLFVVDASSSMNDSFGPISRYEATIVELVAAIQTLPPSIKFNVAMFDAGIHWTDGTFELHNATNANKQSMIDEVEQVDNDSGTNYSAGLSLPTMFTPVPDQVIFLSDGDPSDNSYLSDLATLVSLGVRVDTIALDSSSSSQNVLQNIADQTGGTLYIVEEP